MLPGGQFSKKAAGRSGKATSCRGGRREEGGREGGRQQPGAARGEISGPPADRGYQGGRRNAGDGRGGAGGGPQFFTSLRMRVLLCPTSDTAALAFLEAS